MGWVHDPAADEWTWADEAELFQPAARLTAAAPRAAVRADDGAASPDDRTYAPRLGTAAPRDPFLDPANVDYDAQVRWAEENVFSRGWTIDGLTGEIIDPATDEVKGVVPAIFRMN